MRARLDRELVRRGLARSREAAADLVQRGLVRVDGQVATKVATQVGTGAAIVVDEDASTTYVSRGAHKLIGALDAFAPSGLAITGRRALDLGASTGGFTQVLLERGASEVVAVDVGYGQLAWPLRQDPRVLVRERCNARTLTLDDTAGTVDLVVGDLSFISLALILPAVVPVTASTADLCVMVKPQFEVGRDRVGAGGVVRDPEARAEAVLAIARCARGLGLRVRDCAVSPLPGPSGNVEFFLWLSRPDAAASDAPGDRLDSDEVDRHIHAVVTAGLDGMAPSLVVPNGPASGKQSTASRGSSAVKGMQEGTR